MPNETILITCLPDGTYHVKTTEAGGEGPDDMPLDQTVGSVDEVLQLVQQELSDDQDESPDDEAAEAAPASPARAGKNPAADQAWDEEAAKRQPTDM